MTETIYKIVISQSAIRDITNIRRYILEHFKYTQLGNNFLRKIRNAIQSIEVFPLGNRQTDFSYRDYDIFLKTSKSYLIFYVVDKEKHIVILWRVLQDSMNWNAIISSWLIETNN